MHFSYHPLPLVLSSLHLSLCNAVVYGCRISWIESVLVTWNQLFLWHTWMCTIGSCLVCNLCGHLVPMQADRPSEGLQKRSRRRTKICVETGFALRGFGHFVSKQIVTPGTLYKLHALFARVRMSSLWISLQGSCTECCFHRTSLLQLLTPCAAWWTHASSRFASQNATPFEGGCAVDLS